MKIESKIDPLLKQRKIEDLLDLPQVVLVNNFNESSATAFRDAINKAAAVPGVDFVPVIIDSYGGYVDSLNHMVDSIKTLGKPVATICLGKAMSCGAALFTCGSEGLRYMAPTSRLMIHDVSSASWGKTKDIVASAEETNRLNEQLYIMMARNIGKPDRYLYDLVQAKSRVDWYLTPDEAKVHNLCNVVGIPKLTLEVSVKVSLS